MNTRLMSLIGSISLFILMSSMASAVVVTLPNTQAVTLTASVSEQCNITALPSAVSFNVVSHLAATDSADQTVTLDNIVLLNGKKLRISLKASAASFTPPAGAIVTWNAGDVSWNDGGSWTNGSGVAGVLATTYNEVVTSTANAPTLSSTGLVFTLAGKDGITRAGNYTLDGTWKLEGNI